MARGRKGKGEKQLVSEKVKVLQKFWSEVHAQLEQLEHRMNHMCDVSSNKIRKMYLDRLKKLPENVRSMTLTEYLEMVRQTETNDIQKQVHTEELVLKDVVSGRLSAYRSQFERTRLESEKKKTLKKMRSERKRSMSVTTSSTNKTFCSALSSRNRVFSESSLNTPLSKVSKVSVVPTYAVTPKFNPSVPVSKACMRRPRAGELVLSMSGSPLHNCVDDIPDKPGVAVSLGGGKVIKITEDTEVSKLENDFIKKLDEETKLTLASVKEKLDKMLQP